MFTIDRAQLTNISKERFSELRSRIDHWLLSEVRRWASYTEEERHTWIDEILLLGQENGMRSDMDYALFTGLMAKHCPEWRDFTDAPAQQAVLTCQRRNSGAKVRELSILSERYANSRIPASNEATP